MKSFVVASLRRQYTPGLRLKCVEMKDPYPIPPGTEGTVRYVDDVGQIHMSWDNGSSLALIPGTDEFEVISPEMTMTM